MYESVVKMPPEDRQVPDVKVWKELRKKDKEIEKLRSVLADMEANALKMEKKLLDATEEMTEMREELEQLDIALHKERTAHKKTKTRVTELQERICTMLLLTMLASRNKSRSHRPGYNRCFSHRRQLNKGAEIAGHHYSRLTNSARAQEGNSTLSQTASSAQAVQRAPTPALIGEKFLV